LVLIDLREKLSPHFSLYELTRSDVASRLGIQNVPSESDVESMKLLCNEVLEEVRSNYGIPFSPSSGYRSESLNVAIGGSPSSQHCLGQAVDFEIPGISNLEVASFISSNLRFDQLILEYYEPSVTGSGWVHVSLVGEMKLSVSESNRSEAMRFDGVHYENGII
jgi:zinc D-Ala-D-Ala carboxypeptidase